MAIAVVFDLDGTLIDSRGTIVTACNHALEWAGHVALPADVIAGFVGDGARNLMTRALGADALPADVDAALVEFLRYYEAHPVAGTTWMPAARETLDALADHPLALVTNKARGVALLVLEALGVVSRFASIVAGGDGPLKPDPAPIRRAISAMRATAEHTWVVGDGVQDVLAGRAAGCKTAAVSGGFTSESKLRSAGPDVFLQSVAELLPLLELSAGSKTT